MKRIPAVMLVLLLLCVAYLPAAADGPEVVDQWVDDYDWVIGDEDPAWNCGDYPIIDRIKAEGRALIWKDKDGYVTKLVIESAGVDSLYTEAHPEIVLKGHFGWKATFTDYNGGATDDPFLDWDTVMVRGQDWNIRVPGQGNVVHIAGQGLWPWIPETGHEEVKFAGLYVFDIPTLCKALGF